MSKKNLLYGISIGFVILILSSNIYPATLLFSDGFESGDLSKWNYPPSSSVVNIGCNNGKYCAKIDYYADKFGPHGNNKALLSPPLNEVYVKFYIKFDRAYHHPYLGMKYIRLKDTLGRGQAEHYFNSEGFFANGHTYQETPLKSFDVWYSGKNGEFMAFDHSWHKVELYIKYNEPGRANGVHRVWFDGKLVKDKSNAVFRDNTWPTMVYNRFDIPSNAGDGVHRSQQGDVIYIDDVEIWDGVPDL